MHKSNSFRDCIQAFKEETFALNNMETMLTSNPSKTSYYLADLIQEAVYHSGERICG